MSTTLQTTDLTDFVLATLQAVEFNGAPIAIGDMEIPPEVGWGAQPMVPGAEFTPYGILVPMTATPLKDEGMRGGQQDWLVPHVVQYYGVRRDQCQFIGDQLRAAFADVAQTVVSLGDANYKISQVQADTIGAPTRVPGTSPAYFGGQDQITVWLNKRST